MKLLRSCIVVVALGVAPSGCGTPPHVPTGYEGEVRLVVLNSFGSPVCKLSLRRAGDASSENWLGRGSKRQPLATQERREFMVQPGTYKFSASGCASYSTWEGFDDALTLKGPTLISVAFPAKSVPPGLRSVQAPIRDTLPMTKDAPGAPADCVGPGARAPSVGRCCTGVWSEGTCG